MELSFGNFMIRVVRKGDLRLVVMGGIAGGMERVFSSLNRARCGDRKLIV